MCQGRRLPKSDGRVTQVLHHIVCDTMAFAIRKENDNRGSIWVVIGILFLRQAHERHYLSVLQPCSIIPCVRRSARPYLVPPTALKGRSASNNSSGVLTRSFMTGVTIPWLNRSTLYASSRAALVFPNAAIRAAQKLCSEEARPHICCSSVC